MGNVGIEKSIGINPVEGTRKLRADVVENSPTVIPSSVNIRVEY
jgi:hypothetical protein